ncbi:hypothetical protein [Nocardioides speluncae]|uniref:hypothetical protein n=1 Tax=Nocardioides speluncae TaxID=2670337 RepID=UPI000D69F1C1|nr:hypothetical protein [Nocardioides speluncae]
MEAGTSRSVNIAVGVGAVIHLFDNDDPDADDFLGANTIDSVDGEVDVYTFADSDYKYRLSVRPRSWCS